MVLACVRLTIVLIFIEDSERRFVCEIVILSSSCVAGGEDDRTEFTTATQLASFR